MSEKQVFLTSEGGMPPELSHRRILVLMAAIIVVAAIAGFVFASTNFGAGVLVGGVMSFINYFWQRNSTRAIFAQAANGEKPMLLAVRYILRYVIFGLILWFFHATGAFPIAAIILGLASFAFAIVIEGTIGIFSNFNRRES